ncbi:MAG: A/G-specific adenine glycosylase [Chloroflexi bacterium RBG_13_50_21]|nr:MAG: A/G-specific adenine glycosylase [Chloroflexi bacterium RBG_13_50_21]
MAATLFSTHLLSWYASHARSLPWRGHPDPYAVWVSEIMLQQTRVETAIPYFERWMQRFPSTQALANASMQEVLALWEGLGYYGRARNIYQAAQLVMKEYNGQLPEEPHNLRKLPGVGRYTAGAIASIAFGRDEPTLDGNIRRVVARYFNVSEDARSTRGERELWGLAAQHLPIGHAGEYNQALMDLGASVCTPKSPDCTQCPLGETCQARKLGIIELRPVFLPRPAIPHHVVTAAVITRDGRVLIARRLPHGLLGGMWEFPGGKKQESEDLATCLQREICEELGVDIMVGMQIGVYKHAYTHFRVTLYAFMCTLVSGEPSPIQAAEVRWVSPTEFPKYPMGKIDRRISQTLVSSMSL